MAAYGDNWILINAKKKWLHEQYLRSIKEETTGESAELRTDGHYDVHGLTDAHLAWIKTHPEVTAAKGPVTLKLPDDLPGLPSALVPAGEHEVHYARRPGRNYNSRMIHGPYETSREVTVISVPKKQADGTPVLTSSGNPQAFVVTAFGGKLAPKEVDDPSHTEESREESKKFWSRHALLTGETS